MPADEGVEAPKESEAPALKASAEDLVAADELPPVAVKVIGPFLPNLAEEGLSSRLQPEERSVNEKRKMNAARAEVSNFPEKGKTLDVRERTC